MRLAIALFVVVVSGIVTVGLGLAVLDGRIGRSVTPMHAIHYDTNYDLSAQSRIRVR